MKEFTDFLGAQSPYDALSAEALSALAHTIEVEYYTQGTVVVQQDAAPLHHLYVIRSGSAEVVDTGRVIDLLTVGDTFGQVSALSGLAPAVSIRAAEDLLCYRIQVAAETGTQVAQLRFSGLGRLSRREQITRGAIRTHFLDRVSHHARPPLWCHPADTVSAVARSMSTARESCALLRVGETVGIVTDSDFRRALAEDPQVGSAPIAAIASHHAIAVDESALVAEAFLTMIDHNVHHLLIRGAGGRIPGLVRIVDLASAEVRQPVLLQAAINTADTSAELERVSALIPTATVELLRSGLPIGQLGNLVSALLDGVTRKVLALQPAPTPAETSWLVLGSVGRREPLLSSDLDSAQAWSDALGTSRTRQSLLALAADRIKALERCGLVRCSNGVNADNPLFAHSLTGWKELERSWVEHPTQDRALLFTSMLIDSRPVDGVAIGRAVTDALLEVPRSPDFLELLTSHALSRRPPVGFVRNFVVESSGEHRGRLDLKAGGLVPIASIGRWIAVLLGDDRGSTPVRLRKGADAGLLRGDEADVLIEAFEDVYGLLMERECSAVQAGDRFTTWLAPRELNELTRRHLRETFRAISDVQTTLESEWLTRAR